MQVLSAALSIGGGNGDSTPRLRFLPPPAAGCTLRSQPCIMSCGRVMQPPLGVRSGCISCSCSILALVTKHCTAFELDAFRSAVRPGDRGHTPHQHPHTARSDTWCRSASRYGHRSLHIGIHLLVRMRALQTSQLYTSLSAASAKSSVYAHTP